VKVQGLQAQQALLKAGGDATASGLAVSGTASFSALGDVQLGSSAAAGGVVGGGAEVRAGDLDVLGGFSAPSLTVEARYGGVALGATSVAGRSLSLGQSDFDNLSGVNGGRMSLAIYAGLRATAADPGAVFAGEAATLGDIAVGALGVDSARLQSLSLYASPSNKVAVTGALTPTDAAASTALTIGSLSDPAWQPALIEVVNDGAPGQASGSLGSLSGSTIRPFQTVSLNAVHDILLGSSAFMTAVEALPAADINLTRNMPAVAPNVGRAEMIVTGALDVHAQGKVLQQNTAGGQGTATGVLLGGSTVSGPLLTIGTTATGLTSTATPAVVEFFLSLNDNGATVSNQIAATSNRIILDVAPSNQYRANGCVIGVAGNCSPVDNFIVELQPDRLTEVDLLRRAEDDGAEDPTVAGAANEEIWRKPE
jgi:hypothetical protein